MMTFYLYGCFISFLIFTFAFAFGNEKMKVSEIISVIFCIFSSWLCLLFLIVTAIVEFTKYKKQ